MRTKRLLRQVTDPRALYYASQRVVMTFSGGRQVWIAYAQWSALAGASGWRTWIKVGPYATPRMRLEDLLRTKEFERWPEPTCPIPVWPRWIDYWERTQLTPEETLVAMDAILEQIQ